MDLDIIKFKNHKLPSLVDSYLKDCRKHDKLLSISSKKVLLNWIYDRPFYHKIGPGRKSHIFIPTACCLVPVNLSFVGWGVVDNKKGLQCHQNIFSSHTRHIEKFPFHLCASKCCGPIGISIKSIMDERDIKNSLVGFPFQKRRWKGE